MPKVAGHKIQVLTSIQAKRAGYLTSGESAGHEAWVLGNTEERTNKRFVYIDGVYAGMADATTPLYKVVEKFVH